jgi:hypothetical protein
MLCKGIQHFQKSYIWAKIINNTIYKELKQYISTHFGRYFQAEIVQN